MGPCIDSTVSPPLSQPSYDDLIRRAPVCLSCLRRRPSRHAADRWEWYYPEMEKMEKMGSMEKTGPNCEAGKVGEAGMACEAGEADGAAQLAAGRLLLLRGVALGDGARARQDDWDTWEADRSRWEPGAAAGTADGGDASDDDQRLARQAVVAGGAPLSAEEADRRTTAVAARDGNAERKEDDAATQAAATADLAKETTERGKEEQEEEQQEQKQQEEESWEEAAATLAGHFVTLLIFANTVVLAMDRHPISPTASVTLERVNFGFSLA